MKSVRVRFFAIFREQAGVGVYDLQSHSLTTGELFNELAGVFPQLKTEAAALVAINDSMSNWEHEFSEGDEVLFFPPVAGG